MNKEAYFTWFKHAFKPAYSDNLSKKWSDELRRISEKKFGKSRVLTTRRLKKARKRKKEFLVDMAIFRKASLQPQFEKMAIAVEWQWDFGKFSKDFLPWDFPKLLHVNAELGVAILLLRNKKQYGQVIKVLYKKFTKFRREKEILVIIMEVHKHKKVRYHQVEIVGYDLNKKRQLGRYEMVIKGGKCEVPQKVFIALKSHGVMRDRRIGIDKSFHYFFPDPGKKFVLESRVGKLEVEIVLIKKVLRRIAGSDLEKWYEKMKPEYGEFVEFAEVERKKRYKMILHRKNE